VVFPRTTPNGRLVHLYGRAVETQEQVPKAKRHDHPRTPRSQHAGADGWQARHGATVHGTGCRYFPLHADAPSGTLAGSETFCHAAGQHWRPARTTPGDRTMEAVAPPPTFRLTLILDSGVVGFEDDVHW